MRAAGFTGRALETALGVCWIEGDGPSASRDMGFPAVYYDAVGDLDLLDLPLDPKKPDGPKVSSKYGPSISHFQIRALRDPNGWGELDKVRIAELLRDPEYASHAAFVLSRGGADFTPWSAFKSGSYLPHVGKDYTLVAGHPCAGDWSK